MADRSAAMVSLSLDPGNTECLYTEAPPLLEALAELFERYWAAASPLAGTPVPASHRPPRPLPRSGRNAGPRMRNAISSRCSRPASRTRR